MALRVSTLCVDAADPVALAHWWAALLGWDVTDEEDDEVGIEPPAGSPERGVSPELLFVRVPDAKVVKNRLHLDLRPADRDAEVARAEALGATRVDIGQGEQTWVVLADPEGNEFCILRALRPEE
ncbi:MAG: VOC family protein [Actinomycetota bacterium]